MNEINKNFTANNVKLNDKKTKDLLYYVTMFISTYFESRRAYLNKVCTRLNVDEEQYLRDHLDSESSFLDVNLICIEHLNYKNPKPQLKDDYKLFLAIYRGYMYCEFDLIAKFFNK